MNVTPHPYSQTVRAVLATLDTPDRRAIVETQAALQADALKTAAERSAELRDIAQEFRAARSQQAVLSRYK